MDATPQLDNVLLEAADTLKKVEACRVLIKLSAHEGDAPLPDSWVPNKGNTVLSDFLNFLLKQQLQDWYHSDVSPLSDDELQAYLSKYQDFDSIVPMVPIISEISIPPRQSKDGAYFCDVFVQEDESLDTLALFFEAAVPHCNTEIDDRSFYMELIFPSGELDIKEKIVVHLRVPHPWSAHDFTGHMAALVDQNLQMCHLGTESLAFIVLKDGVWKINEGVEISVAHRKITAADGSIAQDV